MISSGGVFCARMLAGKLKKLKQMRVRKLIADADFMFNRFGRSILKCKTSLKNQEDYSAHVNARSVQIREWIGYRDEKDEMIYFIL